jgi:transcriptional regulator with XRE-family HTH domain
MDEAQITETIKSWRWRIAKAGLTEGAFAARVKMTKCYFSMIMNGKHRPRALKITKVEQELEKLGV